MAAKHGNVVFHERREEGGGYASYCLLVSEIPDQGIAVATVVVLADDGSGPGYTHISVEGWDVDVALGAVEEFVEEKHDRENWVKFSNCP